MVFLSGSAVALALAFGADSPGWSQEASWPDVSSPARSVGGGEHDAAVVVGVENYFAVPGVPGAEANAKAWYDYLTKTRGADPGRVKMRLGNDATREEMLDAARKAAAKAGPDGTLWFVFIGHGAPSSDGRDGLLVGVDAQQKAESLQARSLGRGELLKALGASQAGKIVVVLDACFSGRGSDGTSIAPGLQPLRIVAAGGAVDPRMAVLTAAKGDQFAGALPGTNRPAFSYLVLGGLRGWAGQAKVTAKDLWKYAGDALDATLVGRNQTPDLIGKGGIMVGPTSGEKGPDLAALAKATAGGGAAGGGFQVTNLPAVPKAQAPHALESDAAGGLDFRSLDIDALTKKSETVKLDKSGASAEDKAAAWRQLAKDVPQFADKANQRAAQWNAYAAQQKAVEEAKQKRVAARDADWDKLSKLLALDEAVVPESSKANWSAEFLKAYWKLPGVEPDMAKGLAAHVEAGAMQDALKKLTLKAPNEGQGRVYQPKSQEHQLHAIFPGADGQAATLSNLQFESYHQFKVVNADGNVLKDKIGKWHVIYKDGRVELRDWADTLYLVAKDKFKIVPEKHDIPLSIVGDGRSRQDVVGNLEVEPTLGGFRLALETPEPISAPASAGASLEIGIEWVEIPGGTFTMGSSNYPDAQPHQVVVKSFQMAKTLVTNKQYKACVDAGVCTASHVSDGACLVYNGSSWHWGNLPDKFQGDDQPVVCVDWEQAKAYAQWVGGRLPSEAEWEYAARSAGKDWKYPWGNEEVTCERAVMNDGGLGCGRSSTWPVCSKAKGNTEQDLCDMAGNAWEWVEDWYHGSYNGAPSDGSAWEDAGSVRAARGGSWYAVAAFTRSAHRAGYSPGYRDRELGFRPAR